MAQRAVASDSRARRQPRTQSAPRLRVVAGSARRRRSVGVVALLVATVFGVVGLQAYIAQEGLRVATLERQVNREEERLTLLRASQAQMASPSRLADEAAKLGMVADGNPTYLRMANPSQAPSTNTDLHAFEYLTKQSP